MSLRPAKDLNSIALNCTPDPLDGEKLDAFFVKTDDARDEKNHLREKLKKLFNIDDRPKRVLVYGHRGCGKSTELNRLKTEIGSSWFIVDFSIKHYLPPVGVKAEDILLAMSIAIVDKLNGSSSTKASDKPAIDIDSNFLDQIHAFFDDLTITEKNTLDNANKASAEASVGTPSLWSSIFKLKASVSSELTYGSKNEESRVKKIRQRPGDLLAAVNGLILAVEEALKEKGRKLMIVVEDLDKLQLAEANDVFVNNNLLLAGINTNIIYTIPIFTFHTSEADAIRASFDDVMHLPMIKVANPDGSITTADDKPTLGYDKVKEIILRRVDPTTIDPDALDLLIRGTGGVLRHVFEALQAVSSYANIRDNHIRRKDIRSALNTLRVQIGVSIGWPRDKSGNQKKPDDLYQTLAVFARNQLENQTNPPRNDPEIHILLRSCALIEYNGTGWLGVHPLAWEYVCSVVKDSPASPYGI